MNKQPNDSINQEPKQSGASEEMFNPSCKIDLIRNDEGRVTGVEVVCDTPEARSEMALAMSDFVIKVRVTEELLPGETPGVSRP